MLAVRASYTELVQALDQKEAEKDREGGQSLCGAAVNLTKLCLGTGILALPFATTKGGTMFVPVGIALIALLNGYSCQILIECKKRTANARVPVGLSSTYSKIAYCSGGWTAVAVTDASIIITLLGVCISYQITFASLMGDFLQGLGGFASSSALSIVSFVILMTPALAVEDISSLTKFSLSGLVALLAAVCAIVVFGVQLYGADVAGGNIAQQQLPLYPASLEDFSACLGVLVFGFGICSLVFPVEESMESKADFPAAVLLCLVVVWVAYSVVGVGVAVLFVHAPAGVASNVLENLPSASVAAQLVRLAMSATCLLTFPLAFVPPAKMLESYLLSLLSLLSRCAPTSLPHLLPTLHHTEINANINANANTNINVNGGEGHFERGEPPRLSTPVRYANRALLLAACTSVSCRFPCFGLVVSLLGCFTVSILSFILPPFFRLKLVSLPSLEADPGAASLCPQAAGDALLTLLGTVLCLVSSVVVSQQILTQSTC